MTAPRIATTAVLTALGAAAVLAGCTTTQYSCQNGVCTVTLSGAGASTDPAGYTIELAGADDDVAEFAINGQTATCTTGQTVQVSGYSATCTEVGEDRLVVEVS